MLETSKFGDFSIKADLKKLGEIQAHIQEHYTTFQNNIISNLDIIMQDKKKLNIK